MSRPLRIEYPGAFYHVTSEVGGVRPTHLTYSHISHN